MRKKSKEKHRYKAEKRRKKNHKRRAMFTSEDLDYYLDRTVGIPPASWCLD